MEPLAATEARVLGCLIEKQMTTPEYYPLTTNALVAACNQRTNRDPVVDYDQATVTEALTGLEERGLAGITRTGRSTKHVHRAGDALGVDTEQLALLAVLLLRGPQTPGELRARTERYVEFGSIEEVEARLEDLTRRDVPLVERMPREPGKKEHRYRTLLTESSVPAPSGPPSAEPPGPPPADLELRLADLERRVEALERIVSGDSSTASPS